MSSVFADRNPVWEGITYLRRFRRKQEEVDRTAAELNRVLSKPYFLFPLQLNSDYQIRLHSPYESMHEPIRSLLESFARFAPQDVNLIVKEHPLDSGLNDWRAFVDAAATELDIRDRVAFVEHGDITELVQGSRGMVTVNSTSGTLSLSAGRPVKVLGSAVYDIPDITDQQPLETFWSAPSPPDPAAWDAFYRLLAHQCLIHGAFLSNAGIDLLVVVATGRLFDTDETEDTIPAGLR